MTSDASSIREVESMLTFMFSALHKLFVYIDMSSNVMKHLYNVSYSHLLTLISTDFSFFLITSI